MDPSDPTREVDPVIEAYKKDVDRTLLRENLNLSVDERFRRLMELQRFAAELRRAGRESRHAVTDFQALLGALAGSGVEFIVVGGAAATAHGSARLTQDLDVVYRRTPENIERLARSLDGLHPYLRGAPPGLPFRWDAATIRRGLDFPLTTALGELELLGEIVGGGSFEALLPEAIELRIFGLSCRCLSLRKLIESKRAAGRPKDLEAIAELEALHEETG